MFGDEAVDGGLEVGDGVEHAPLELFPGELGEEPLDGVEPRRRGGGVNGGAIMGGYKSTLISVDEI